MKRGLLLIAALVPLGGCDNMSVQPKQKAYSPLVGPVQIPSGTVEYDDKPTSAPPVTLALIERGQERFRIYCTPCHSELGDGRGNGYGAMYSFADRVQPEDRWAIVAYIRALQRSQHAALADVATDQRGALQ